MFLNGKMFSQSEPTLSLIPMYPTSTTSNKATAKWCFLEFCDPSTWETEARRTSAQTRKRFGVVSLCLKIQVYVDFQGKWHALTWTVRTQEGTICLHFTVKGLAGRRVLFHPWLLKFSIDPTRWKAQLTRLDGKQNNVSIEYIYWDSRVEKNRVNTPWWLYNECMG